MLPAKKDNNPSKWESFGDITITLKDDAKVKVGIYSPSKGPNAFAVGNTVRERVYYRF